MILDFEQIMYDYAECCADKSRIKFIEKYLSTFNASAGRMTPFNLFPRQKVFLHSIADNPASIAIKHRQCGITTVSSAWVCGQIVFASQESPEIILCIGNKLDLANQLVEKIRDFLLQVPRWYWGDDYYSPDPNSEKNKRDIFVKNSKSELVLFNGCKVFARSSGENAARGISAISVLLLDEAAFIENGLAVYTSAVAASASNPNRKIIMVSTPNGKDELYYNTYRQALAKENNYNAVEFKWYQDLRYNKFLKWYKQNEKTGEKKWIEEEILDESGTIEYNEEKWKKLEQDGWKPTNPWYEEMCKSFNNDPMKIAQELDVSFMGSANNVVSPEYIDIHSTLNVREPLEDLKDPMNDDMWFWKPPIEGHRYICACLPEGEEIMTQRGLVNVEHIKQDDLLVTKEGEYTAIKYRKYREVRDEEVVKIKISNMCNYTTFTWNHPIYASCNTKSKRNLDFKFVDAKDVNVNDWVQMPNLYMLKEKSKDEILSFWNYDEMGIDFKINNPLLNEYYWWYCGIWLAKGRIKEDKYGNLNVCTSHNINDVECINKISKISNEIFNIKVSITNCSYDNTTLISINSKEISKFLTETFGEHAENKYISEWVKFLPNNLKLQIIKGYIEGNGCFEQNKLHFSITSINKTLLQDVQDILFSLGIISSLKPHTKKDNYILTLCENDTQELMKMFSLESNVTITNQNIMKDVLFSDDKKTIYFKVTDKIIEQYTGKVYNFETVSESHTFSCRGIVTHNCDPSRGTSEDRTAIEIIDMDGRDENGLPIIEQVAEYVGRKLGDDVGGMVYEYATMYNNAYVVVDATGGQGDACILTLINMGYKNLHYEDSSQKTYTLQNISKNCNDYSNKLPGFHFQGNRYPVLSHFAGLVRNNEFKIRSVRVINELDTWIFKGDTGRMDHMSNAHDDTLTSLAMGLFVMQYSINKLQDMKNKDAAILGAYMMNSGIGYNRRPNSIDMRPKVASFYNNKMLPKSKANIPNSNFMWLFGNTK